jgi:ribosome-associated translation inhibitor RaiA
VTSLEGYVREKLDQFDKEARIVRANVVSFIGSDSNPNKYYREIRLEGPVKDHFVKKSSDSFETAIVDAVNTFQHAMRKVKRNNSTETTGNCFSFLHAFFIRHQC